MDGFHYSRAHLAGMANPTEAIHRRGAAFTFDAPGFLALIQALVAKPVTTVLGPSFDHAVKDPVADAIAMPPTAVGPRELRREGWPRRLDHEGQWGLAIVEC